jgi:hypothetical protein
MCICICGCVVWGFVKTVTGFFVFFIFVFVFVFVVVSHLVFIEAICGSSSPAIVFFFFGLTDGAEDAEA